MQYGDATELWVLERAGIQRADLVIAVTGDDEDNMLVCQVAKEKYLCERIIARVNNPRNSTTSSCSGSSRSVSATDLILRLIEHEVPRYGLVHLLALEEERLEIIELEVSPDGAGRGRARRRRRAAGGQPDHLRAARRRRLRADAPTRSSRPATRCCSCSTRASRSRSPPSSRRTRAPPRPERSGRPGLSTSGYRAGAQRLVGLSAAVARARRGRARGYPSGDALIRDSPIGSDARLWTGRSRFESSSRS